MYKINEINYNETTYLNKDTISYHRILHKRYLDNLNKLLLKNDYNFQYTIDELINNLEIFYIEDRDDILFNLGGVLNHNLYFINIEPNQIKINNNNFLKKINSKYNSFSNFKNIFKEEALKLVGSGYTFLILDKNNDFKIISLPNQETPLIYGFRPLIALDLWEHSYYLQYNVKKSEYIDKFLENLNLDNINNIYNNYIKR